MLVVVDDFDLPLGKLRLRERGTAGGHNGLRSIIGELGSQDFARLRVGIGEPRETRAKDHVLSRFGASERSCWTQVVDAAADAVEDWARLGAARAANKWNAWAPDVERRSRSHTELPSHREPMPDDPKASSGIAPVGGACFHASAEEFRK